MSKKVFGWILIASIFMVGCDSDSPSANVEVAMELSSPEESKEFVNVLVDIQLLEATLKQKVAPIADTDSVMKANYKIIFDKHGWTQEYFDEQYAYWKARPRDMIVIYEEVLERLNKLDGELREDAE